MTVLPFPHDPHNVRNTDPVTAWRASRINQRYRSGLRFNMLVFHGEQLRDNAYYYVRHGLTDYEIVQGMGLPVLSAKGKPLCNWKRHGESYTDYGHLDLLIVEGVAVERDGQRALIINERGLIHIDEVLRLFPHNDHRY